MSKTFAVLLLASGCAASPAPVAAPTPPPAPPASVPRPAPKHPADEIGVAPAEPELGVEGVGEPPVTLEPHPTDPDVAAALADAAAGKLPAALHRLARAEPRLDREASLQDKLLAHALMGRSYDRAHKRTLAAAQYRKVIEIWAGANQAAKQIAAADDESARRNLGQALSSVGEALHFEAEQKRRVTDALKPPRYVGGSAVRFTKEKIAPWLSKRRALLDEATAAYSKVIELSPAPPPRWVVASAAHVGAMLESFVDDFAAIPAPASLRSQPELLAAYERNLSDMLEPQRQRAVAAYKMCQSYGQRFQIDDENTRRCAERLKVLDTGP